MATLEIANDYTAEILAAKDQAVLKALTKIGLTAEKYAKKSLTDSGAVDTGRLRNSVSHAEDGNSTQVGTNVEYGPYIELGTSRMRARPFIKPSIENHLEEYKQIFTDTLKSG